MTIIKTPTVQAKKRKKGFTLTEIAIVLGIIGLILGAIWSAAASVYSNQRISHANTEILQVTQGIRGLMATSTEVGAAGNITANMISAGVIPSDSIAAGAAVGPWPGSTLKILTVAATDTAFTVEMNKIPVAGCIGLLTMVGGQNADPGLTGIGSTTASAPVAKGTVGTALALSTTPVGTPVTATEAAAACSAAGSANFVQFEFTIK